MKQSDVIIIGGGAAGFFTAINIAKYRPDLKVVILERGKEVLQKVKVSGGGRCNVTHACFEPKELTQYYPRGQKELLGPFHQFACGDTFAWFEERGIELKVEDDGRVFPTTDNSQTIIDCFLKEAQQYGVEVITQTGVIAIEKQGEYWLVESKAAQFKCNALVVTAGSSTKIWKMLSTLDHTIIPPVPSLFTFNTKDERIADIPGVVAQNVQISVKGTNLESFGPLLVTHWGLSAPAILKLSAYGARILADKNYKFEIEVNFIGYDSTVALAQLKELKQELAKATVFKNAQFDLPKRLWRSLVRASKIGEDTRWADLNKKQLEALTLQLTAAIFKIDGKSTFKEEFVTAGGIALKEVNFKRFESRLHNNLFFAGEVLNIDAVTGGFNFQNAWTGGHLIAQAIIES